MEFIYNGNSDKSGIYKITNKTNNRFYYGSCKEFRDRWRGHKSSLLNNKHQNKFLQADFNKCFIELKNDDFLIFEVIEVVEGGKALRLKIEEEKYLKPNFDSGKECYNLCDRAISPEGYELKNPEETKKRKINASKKLWEDPKHREKIIEANKNRYLDENERKKTSDGWKKVWANPEYREMMSQKRRGENHPLWGTKVSLETKEKISEANKGKHNHTNEYKKKMSELMTGKKYALGYKHTKEAKEKMSLKRMGRKLSAEHIKTIIATKSKSVMQFDKNMKFLFQYSSMKEAAEKTNISYWCIKQCSSGHRKMAGGYIWKYDIK